MTNREFYIRRWELERPKFVKVMQAMPNEQLSYKPHERSGSAAEIAWQLAEEQRVLCDLARKGALEWVSSPPPETIEETIQAYEEHADELRQCLDEMTEEKWSGDVTFKIQGHEIPAKMDDLFWGFLFDAVHHRGQLMAYLRPMGGRVPAIYGPSADEMGG
jgi:uncharacterized damage-inducible protein DinB